MSLAIASKCLIVRYFSRRKILRIGTTMRDHHGQAGEDRAGHEVGREDGGVPAGHDAHREVPGHDRVHGEHERRGQRGEVE